MLVIVEHAEVTQCTSENEERDTGAGIDYASAENIHVMATFFLFLFLNAI